MQPPGCQGDPSTSCSSDGRCLRMEEREQVLIRHAHPPSPGEREQVLTTHRACATTQPRREQVLTGHAHPPSSSLMKFPRGGGMKFCNGQYPESIFLDSLRSQRTQLLPFCSFLIQSTSIRRKGKLVCITFVSPPLGP